MGGYVGARAGSLLATTAAEVQDLTATDTTPEVTIVNSTHEDTDGGREGKVTFKGQQSGGEESTLAQIQASHDGTSDDEKGDLIFKTNDGSDGASPTEAMRIDSAGNVGIGTADPHDAGANFHMLTLNGPKGGGIVFSDDDVNQHMINTTDDNSLRFTRGSGLSDESMRIDSDGKVRLQQSSVVTASTDADDFVIEKTGDTGLSILSTTTGRIYFGDAANDDAGSIRYVHTDNSMRFETDDAERMRIDTDGLVGIGRSPSSSTGSVLQLEGADGMAFRRASQTNSFTIRPLSSGDGMRFTQEGVGDVGAWDSGGSLVISETSSSNVANGTHAYIGSNGQLYVSSTSSHFMNKTADGSVLVFRSAGSNEGSVSISGSTTSFNGGHLSRWSRLTSGNRDASILKGTVMTNLDEMVVWSHPAIAEGDEIKDNMGKTITATSDHVRDAYTEDNEQLNCMAVSSVEGDPNVAGVFVNWDNDDDFNDMNVAMTGDMVIRIAKGTTVARGDLLMSAGDGTAKPQGDDIVRSKTIAKVISTNVSHTYDDESYLVPCVLMAC